MVNLHLKNIRLVAGPRQTVQDPQDMIIRNGKISAIGRDLPEEKGLKTIECNQAWVSPGWVDLGTSICDPGYEHREDIYSAAAAAAAGGFTTLACQPNTLPAVDSKGEVLYVRNKAKDLPVEFLPIGAISKHCDGVDLAELIDMHQSGAIAFSDGHKSVQDAGLLLRALHYSQAFNGLIINQPRSKTLSGGGQMHEGKQSTMLGLKGIPSLAEEVMVQRDLSLLAYSGGRLHLHLISSAGSVDMIRKARKKEKGLSASVAVANLFFTDEDLADFDTNYKVNPPFRSTEDQQALIQGLKDGSIDCLCSHHQPWDVEAKNLEFPFADFGILGLETAFAVSRTATQDQLQVEDLVEKWAFAPRSILGLPVPEVKVGTNADLTIFEPDTTWTVTPESLRSKSHNSPFIGKQLQGRVLGIINKNQVVWNHLNGK